MCTIESGCGFSAIECGCERFAAWLTKNMARRELTLSVIMKCTASLSLLVEA
jgi:hypothetical protein